MASLHSLPEHLVGVLYGLLEDCDDRLSFFSCCKEVRTSPSILSQITALSISAEELEESHSLNPLACLPKGVRLTSLELEYREKSPSPAVLFQPSTEGARARVLSTISNLEVLSIIQHYWKQDTPSVLKDPCTLGSFLRQLPLKELKLVKFLPADVIALLQAMSAPGTAVEPDPSWRSTAVLSLERFSYKQPAWQAGVGPEYPQDAVVAALVPFQNLAEVTLECVPVDDFTLLTMLPKLRVLDLSGPYLDFEESLRNVLPRLPDLKSLRMYTLEEGNPIPIVSASLEHLALEYVSELGLVAAAVSGCAPCLRKVEVERWDTNDVIRMEDAVELANTFTALCARFPLLSFCIGQLENESGNFHQPTNFDALSELLVRVPALGNGVKTLYLRSRRDTPCSRLKELPSIVPNLEGITWSGERPEQLSELVPIVRGLDSLRRIKIDWGGYRECKAKNPGMAANILALCVLCASLERARRLCICVDAKTDTGGAEAGEWVRRELSVLNVSWTQAKKVWQSMGRSPPKVTLDTDVHP